MNRIYFQVMTVGTVSIIQLINDAHLIMLHIWIKAECQHLNCLNLNTHVQKYLKNAMFGNDFVQMSPGQCVKISYMITNKLLLYESIIVY